jgi:FkbM family methyltransferase
MFTQSSRHRLLQSLFWNPVGAALVRALIRYERKFDTVVRNYSLMGDTNGERWLLTLMNSNPLVFDVGFHDGASTREILKARPGARVVGFDPSRFAIRAYEADFADETAVSFENVGLSDAPGSLTFFDYDNMCNSLAARKEMPGATGVQYTVPITTLDAYCADQRISHVNFMKIDAEGFDLNVLEGAKGLLANQEIDLFMFEFASGWASAKRYLWEADEFFAPLPYKLYHLFNGFLCPLEYDVRIDSCCTLSAMYVGVSDSRLARGDIPIRNYGF